MKPLLTTIFLLFNFWVNGQNSNISFEDFQDYMKVLLSNEKLREELQGDTLFICIEDHSSIVNTWQQQRKDVKTKIQPFFIDNIGIFTESEVYIFMWSACYEDQIGGFCATNYAPNISIQQSKKKVDLSGRIILRNFRKRVYDEKTGKVTNQVWNKRKEYSFQIKLKSKKGKFQLKKYHINQVYKK